MSTRAERENHLSVSSQKRRIFALKAVSVLELFDSMTWEMCDLMCTFTTSLKQFLIGHAAPLPRMIPIPIRIGTYAFNHLPGTVSEGLKLKSFIFKIFKTFLLSFPQNIPTSTAWGILLQSGVRRFKSVGHWWVPFTLLDHFRSLKICAPHVHSTNFRV